MDRIGQSPECYRSISSISAAILILLFQTYLILLSKGFDLLNFNGVRDESLRLLAEIFVQIVLFSVLYAVIHAAVYRVYCRRWIAQNKSRWVRGTWLHIHARTDETGVHHGIRIGFVEIKQDFDIITGQGSNIFPAGLEGADPLKDKTTWSYTLGRVYESDLSHDYIAYYTATNVITQRRKDGVHELQVHNVDWATGFPNWLVGCFRDTHQMLTDGDGGAARHSGQLQLFRISGSLERYLVDASGFRYDRLAQLHLEEGEFADEPFVLELRKLLAHAA